MNLNAHVVPFALATVLAAGLSATSTPSAQAREERGTSAAVTDAHYLRFNKGTVTNSRLELVKRVPGRDKVIKQWKAGSGQVTNECTVGRGWLPNADARHPYAIQWHRKNFDGIINGLVIKLSDKVCKNGRTKRTELFIHSEMKPNGQQGKVESEKWTNSNPNDYFSNGCIKLNPRDIKDLFSRLDRMGWPKKLYVVA
ncbi:L,D-transpeptidase [Streptomyces atratus]|uniref:L,D-transpeptidase n=1 Tax=Streptomyces atratus TaxID=1893 RepID=UPI002AC3324E|nr:L,D-transpeptidase [Streptomyces atratus]WPW30414.1 L,D-transpeptidase [Streptomyces atratus]